MTFSFVVVGENSLTNGVEIRAGGMVKYVDTLNDSLEKNYQAWKTDKLSQGQAQTAASASASA